MSKGPGEPLGEVNVEERMAAGRKHSTTKTSRLKAKDEGTKALQVSSRPVPSTIRVRLFVDQAVFDRLTV
jgi:hypothetical protein